MPPCPSQVIQLDDRRKADKKDRKALQQALDTHRPGATTRPILLPVGPPPESHAQRPLCTTVQTFSHPSFLFFFFSSPTAHPSAHPHGPGPSGRRRSGSGPRWPRRRPSTPSAPWKTAFSRPRSPPFTHSRIPDLGSCWGTLLPFNPAPLEIDDPIDGFCGEWVLAAIVYVFFPARIQRHIRFHIAPTLTAQFNNNYK